MILLLKFSVLHALFHHLAHFINFEKNPSVHFIQPAQLLDKLEYLFLTTCTTFSEKLRGMREHLCLKVKVLERTIRTSNSRIGFSDMLRNTDNKGVWKFGQTLWEQACTDVLRLEEYL